MIHAFILTVSMITAAGEKTVSRDMIFRDINDCLFFANKTVKVYGNYGYRRAQTPKIHAYCLPVYIDEDQVLY